MSMGRKHAAWSRGAPFGCVMRQASKAAAFANPALQALEKRVYETGLHERAQLLGKSCSGPRIVKTLKSSARRRLEVLRVGMCLSVRSERRGSAALVPWFRPAGLGDLLGLGLGWASSPPGAVRWVTLRQALPRLCLWFCFDSSVSILFR